MTITREQLELAAKAAGHKVTSFEPVGPKGSLVAILGVNAAGYGIHWRPHTDPGDAARLADKLLMYVDSRGTAVQARVVDGEWHRIGRDGNPNAWCEAVVMCAAAFGAKMEGGA